MSAPDIDTRHAAWGGFALFATVAAAIAVGFALVHLWHAPLDGPSSGAASLLKTIEAAGPALQSAPQDDLAAQRAREAAAASEPAR